MKSSAGSAKEKFVLQVSVPACQTDYVDCSSTGVADRSELPCPALQPNPLQKSSSCHSSCVTWRRALHNMQSTMVANCVQVAL